MNPQQKFILGLRLWNFTPDEILFLGGRHQENGLNTLPPQDLLHRIVKTCYVLQLARTALHQPIHILSGYRSPSYNKAVGGSSHSLHMEFNALDCGTSDPPRLQAILVMMRQDGLFQGGIGIYPSFVHVDTRGHNADWDER